MKLLIWDIPDDFKERYIMDYNWRPMEERTNSVIFTAGKTLPCSDVGNSKYSLNPKEYDLIFASESPPEEFTKFDCLPNNTIGHVPLVNQKVLDIFNQLCPNDIQAFPATIIPDKSLKSNFENHDYWLINITSKIDCIDEEKTHFSRTTPQSGSIPIGCEKVVLKNISGFCGIGRDNILKTFKLVSPSLVHAFKEAGVTGVQFIEDKDYS